MSHSTYIRIKAMSGSRSTFGDAQSAELTLQKKIAVISHKTRNNQLLGSLRKSLTTKACLRSAFSYGIKHFIP